MKIKESNKHIEVWESSRDILRELAQQTGKKKGFHYSMKRMFHVLVNEEKERRSK